MDGKVTVELLTTVFPDFLIEAYAEELDVVERQRKVDIVVLVWTVILGFPAGAKRTLASLRRRFQRVGQLTIARSSFHDRFTPAFATLLRRLVDQRLEVRAKQTSEAIGEQFEGFKELLAVDSTVLGLHDLLAPTWEATNEGEAAAKMHVIANVVEGGPNSVELTGQRTADNQPLKTIGGWVEDCLLMGDLAYYDFHLFHRIDQQDGYFLSRVRSDANPRIVGSNQTLPGRAIDVRGRKLQEILGRLDRQTIDVTVALEVELRKYRGRSSTTTRHFRLVGRKDDETGEYHLYFTNISPDRLDPDDLARTYALRWQVELLFKRLKSTLRLHELPSRKEPVVRALIWGSILALLASNALLHAMRRVADDRVIPAERADAVFRDFAGDILNAIAERRCDQTLTIFELMMREAVDPNRHRPRSHDILDELDLANPHEQNAFLDAGAYLDAGA